MPIFEHVVLVQLMGLEPAQAFHDYVLESASMESGIPITTLCERVHDEQHFLQQVVDELEQSGALTIAEGTITITPWGWRLHEKRMIETQATTIVAHAYQCAVSGKWLGIEIVDSESFVTHLSKKQCEIPTLINTSSTPPRAIIEKLDKKYSNEKYLVKTAIIDEKNTTTCYAIELLHAYLAGSGIEFRIEGRNYARQEIQEDLVKILTKMVLVDGLLPAVLGDLVGSPVRGLDLTLDKLTRYPGIQIIPRLEIMAALRDLAGKNGIVIDHADFVGTHGIKENPASYITTTASPDAKSIVEFPGIDQFAFRLTCRASTALPDGIPMFVTCANTMIVPLVIHDVIAGNNINAFMQFSVDDKHPWLDSARKVIAPLIPDAVQTRIRASARLSAIVPALMQFVTAISPLLENAWDSTVSALLGSLATEPRFAWPEARLRDWLHMAIDMYGKKAEEHDAFKNALEAAIDHMNETGERIDQDARIIENAPRAFLTAMIDRAKSPNKFPGAPHVKLEMILGMIVQVLKNPLLAHVAASVDVNELVPVLERLHVMACPAIINDRTIESIRLIDSHYTTICNTMTPIAVARASWRAHIAALISRPGFMDGSNEACIFGCAAIAVIMLAPAPSAVQSEIPPPMPARRPFLADCCRVIDNELQRTEARSFPILHARLRDEKRQLLALWDSSSAPANASDAEMLRHSCSDDAHALALIQAKIPDGQGKKPRRPASIGIFGIKSLKGLRLAWMLSAIIVALAVTAVALVLLLQPHLQEAILYANIFISADLEAMIKWLSVIITTMFVIPLSISVLLILYHVRCDDEHRKRILYASGRSNQWKLASTTRAAILLGSAAIFVIIMVQFANLLFSSIHTWMEPIAPGGTVIAACCFASIIFLAPAKRTELKLELSKDDAGRARFSSILLLVIGVILAIVGSLFQASQFQNHHVKSRLLSFIPALLAGSVTAITLGTSVLLILYAVPGIRRKLHVKRPAIWRDIAATMHRRPRFLVIGIVVLVGASAVTGLVLNASLRAGATLGARTSTGGDVALGNPASFLGNDHMIYTTGELAAIMATTTVDSAAIISNACRYRIAVDYETQKANWASIGATIDGAGWKTLPIGIGGVKIGIIDPSAYLAVNSGSYYKFSAPASAGLDTIMASLNTRRSIILSDELQPVLRKQPGDRVRLVLDGVAMDVEIAAYVDVMPGFPWTMGLTSAFGSVASDQVTGCGIISWATYLAATSAAFHGADILLKSKYWQAGSSYIDGISPGYYGTVGFPVNRTAVGAVLAPYLANGTVLDVVDMVNDPWPCLLEFYNNRALDFDRVNATANRWNPWNASLVAIDTSKPASFSGVRIAAVHGDVPASARGNIVSVLEWWRENQPDLPCIAPSVATAFAPDIQTGDPRLQTVYHLQPGDSIHCLIYGREVSFTVVATLDANTAHDYVQDGIWHRGSPMVSNPVSLSFHPYHPGLIKAKNIEGLSDVLSLTQDAVIIAKEDHATAVLGNIVAAINATRLMNTTAPPWIVEQSTDYLTTSLCNATFKFAANPLDYATLFRLQLPATANATDLAARIGRALARYLATQNMTAIAPRDAFFTMTRFDEGHAWLGLIAAGRGLAPSQIITALGNAHATAGLPFHDVQVKVAGLVAPAIETIMAAADITSVMSWVISITSMVAATVMATAATSRPSAFIGAVLQQHPVPSIKRRSVRITASITGIDDMLGGFIGLSIGFLTGFLLAGILIGSLPFIPAFPVLFTMPWGEIGAAFGVMVAILVAIELSAVRVRRLKITLKYTSN